MGVKVEEAFFFFICTNRFLSKKTRLVTSPSRLGDDVRQLVDLSLSASVGTELYAITNQLRFQF
jgi:hypothetical protein